MRIFRKIIFFSDSRANRKSESKHVFGNISVEDILNVINERLPHFKKNDFIVGSEYKLNILDFVELIIALLESEIVVGKIEASKEKAKLEDNRQKEMDLLAKKAKGKSGSKTQSVPQKKKKYLC